MKFTFEEKKHIYKIGLCNIHFCKIHFYNICLKYTLLNNTLLTNFILKNRFLKSTSFCKIQQFWALTLCGWLSLAALCANWLQGCEAPSARLWNICNSARWCQNDRKKSKKIKKLKKARMWSSPRPPLKYMQFRPRPKIAPPNLMPDKLFISSIL